MENYTVLNKETATMENRFQEILLMPKHNITLSLAWLFGTSVPLYPEHVHGQLSMDNSLQTTLYKL